MIKTVYKVLPAFIIYTNRFIDDGFSGKAFGNIILIKPHYKNDKCLLMHELVHVKQFYKTFGLHSVLYKLSEAYRLKCEIEAYTETIKCKEYTNENQFRWIVKSLSNNYDLSYTYEEINKLLNGSIK